MSGSSGSDAAFGGLLGAVVMFMIWLAAINIMENHCEKTHNIYDCEMTYQPVTKTAE